MRWNTVIFDLDGTLTESGEGIKKSFVYALNMMGITPPDDETLNQVVGPPLKDSFHELAGLDDEGCDRAIALYRQRYTAVGIYENALYPGLKEALERMKAAGMTLAVASSKPDVMVRQILSYFEIDRYFSVIVGSNLDGTRSSKKAVIDEALRRLNMAERRGEIVYVGDRKYDIIGARQCGLSSIGVTYGYGTFEELKAVKPTYMAFSAGHLADLIITESAVFPRQAAGGQETRTAASAAPYIRKESAIGKIWRVIYPVLLYFFISNALTIVIMVAAVPILLMSGGGQLDVTEFVTDHAMTVQGISALITMPFLVAFILADKKRRNAIGSEKLFLDAAKLTPLWIVLAIFLFIAAGSGFGYLIDLTHIPEIDNQFQQFNDMAYSDPLILQILSIGIIGPIAEELIFRGLVYRRIRDYSNIPVAVILSSAIFGAFHMNLTQGLFAFALGILLALLYERTGRLILPMIGHMSNNLMSVLSVDLGSETDFIFSDLFNIGSLVVCLALAVILFVLKKPATGEKIPEKTRKSFL